MNTPKQVTIKIQNETLTGTVFELTLILRDKYKLTQQQIADILGVTKSCISYHLVRLGRHGRLKNNNYEFLTQQLFESKTDEELSVDYDLPMLTIARIRRLRNVGRQQTISLKRRRSILAIKLFGTNPGPNFKSFIENLPFESELQKRNFVDFYLLGKKDTSSNRAYRSKITDILANKLASMPKKELVARGIINE